MQLEVGVPPQQAENLLLQHDLHLHAALQLLQPLCVLAHVEALDLLVGPLQVVQGGLARQCGVPASGCQAVTLEVEPQAAQVDIVPMAVGALVRSLARVQSLVELEVDKLGELGRAKLAVVGLLTRVQAQVGLEVAGAAKALVAHLEEGGDKD